MPENEVMCILSEIETDTSMSNQFCCEIERPFTTLNDESVKLTAKTYIYSLTHRCIRHTMAIPQKN